MHEATNLFVISCHFQLCHVWYPKEYNSIYSALNWYQMVNFKLYLLTYSITNRGEETVKKEAC